MIMMKTKMKMRTKPIVITIIRTTMFFLMVTVTLIMPTIMTKMKMKTLITILMKALAMIINKIIIKMMILKMKMIMKKMITRKIMMMCQIIIITKII